MYKEISSENIKLDKTLGYLYFIDKDHPLASSVGKVMLHRHIASLKLGRWLTPTNIVHHIDSNKLNNEKDNLEVISNSEHAKLHHPAVDRVAVSCPVCNVIFELSKDYLNKRNTCSIECYSTLSRKFSITKEELEVLLWNRTAIDIGKQFDVSDTAIRKRAKLLGCKLPPPYFHNKTSEYKRATRKENNISDLPS